MWSVFALLSIVLYGFAAWRLFAAPASPARLPATGLLALALHAAAIAVTWREGGIQLAFPLAVSAVGLALALVFAVLAASRGIFSLGTAIFPIAAFTLGVHAVLVASGHAGSGARVEDWRILLHAGLALLAFATLLLAALAAVMLGFQERALKARRFLRWMERVPPLTQVEALVFHLVIAGFGLLTVALLTGLLFVEDLMAQHLAHKTVLSVLAWFTYGGLLLARWRLGLRGVRAVRWVLVATVFLSLAYLGSKFVLEILLQRT